jgi:HEAT repeats
VLVTDGMETCHEDPAAVAEAITLKLQLRRVEVVGLGIKDEEKIAVTLIARLGRGKGYDAQTAVELATAVSKAVGVRVTVTPVDDKPAEDQPEPLPPRVKALVEQLQDEDWLARVAAANSLGKMGTKAKGAVPALIKRVADERYGMTYGVLPYNHRHNGNDKNAALAALKAIAPEKVEQALIEATKSKNLNVKRWAGDRLGELDEGKP